MKRRDFLKKSGTAALAAPSEPYDLVVMDWKMPGMDGLEASKRIRGDSILSRTPLIIMVSAYGREEIIRQAEKVGVSAFLMKPVNESLLFDTIMESFGRQSERAPTGMQREGAGPSMSESIEGARVLLVEDNAINRQVATEILAGAGVIVEEAVDGAEAVERVRGSVEEGGAAFDAVLMDVQMPGMDGYEASRRIRSDPRFEGLPIIALTAHAMKGDNDRCLEAGMNDYVTKPIDPDRLFSSLSRWVEPPGGRKGTARRAIGTPAPDLSAPAPDLGAPTLPNDHDIPESLPGIDMESALRRLRGNRGLLRKILLELGSEYGGAASEMEKALAGGDTDTARRLAHTIKGVAGNISAMELHAAARDLEGAMGSGNGERMREAMERFRHSLGTILGLAERLKESKGELQDEAGGMESQSSELLISGKLC